MPTDADGEAVGIVSEYVASAYFLKWSDPLQTGVFVDVSGCSEWSPFFGLANHRLQLLGRLSCTGENQMQTSLGSEDRYDQLGD